MVSLQLARVLICCSFACVFWRQVWSQKLEIDATTTNIPPDSKLHVIPSVATERENDTATNTTTVPKPTVISSIIEEEPVSNPTQVSGESIRFGNTHYSRQEFVKDSGFLESVKDDSVFSLEFKTKGASGVLFYVRGMTPLNDSIGLFMQDGHITYVFDCGSGSAVMTSNNTYNDGRWHHVVFSREAKRGRLIIDNEEEVQATSPGYAVNPNIRYPFYVGGLSEEAAEESKDFLRGINSSFPGCIRNVEAQGELWTLQKQSSAWNTTSCSSRVEGGTFCSEKSGCFYLNCECGDHTIGCKFLENGLKKCLCAQDYADEGGRCTARPRSDLSKESSESVRFGSTPYSRLEYTLDSEFLESIWHDSVFSLEFKTLGETGLLFFVGGLSPNIDYIGLFMQDGKITYVFDCGSGSAVMTSQNTYNDGEWHRVIFSRQAQGGRLIIDDKEEVQDTSPGKNNRMDAKHPFYIGGLSKEGTKEYRNFVKGVYLSFPGCIRNVEAQGMLWTQDKLSAKHKTTTCSGKVEGGTFFYSNGGYLVLHCKCGDHSTGCILKENGTKECLCSVGYVDRGGICAALSATVDRILDDFPHFEDVHVGQCVLPLHPLPDTSADPGEGIRFGNTPYSRQEFSVGEEFLEGLLDDSVFSLDFKTTGDSGILFYLSDGVAHSDHVILFMRRGKIYFVYQMSAGRDTALVSRNRYNDGAWHHVVFWRHVREGRLVIDGVEVQQGVSASSPSLLNVKSPFYVGGLSEEVIEEHARVRSDPSRFWLRGFRRENDWETPPENPTNNSSAHVRRARTPHNSRKRKSLFTSFPGCIRNVEVQDILWTPEMQSGAWNTSTCSKTEERGTFFSAGGGHIILFDKFRVGQELTISMDIKPRNLSGVLFAVHGREDYLVLQLVDGNIEFSVNNGNGPVSATYTPDDKHHLCDGKFHTIRATSKSSNFVTLLVDNEVSEKGLNVSRVSSTDTFDPLYVGGVPTLSKKRVKTTDQFVGCIRNLELNDKPISMAQARPFGQVTLNTCPTT